MFGWLGTFAYWPFLLYLNFLANSWSISPFFAAAFFLQWLMKSIHFLRLLGNFLGECPLKHLSLHHPLPWNLLHISLPSFCSGCSMPSFARWQKIFLKCSSALRRHLGSLSGLSTRVNSVLKRLAFVFPVLLVVISFLFEVKDRSLVLIHFGTLMVRLSSSN